MDSLYTVYMYLHVCACLWKMCLCALNLNSYARRRWICREELYADAEINEIQKSARKRVLLKFSMLISLPILVCLSPAQMMAHTHGRTNARTHVRTPVRTCVLRHACFSSSILRGYLGAEPNLGFSCMHVYVRTVGIEYACSRRN